MRRKLFTLVAGIVATLPGCFRYPASGPDSVAAVNHRIQRLIEPLAPGVTTKAQALALLGEPNGWQHSYSMTQNGEPVDTTDGGRTWFYTYPAVYTRGVSLVPIRPFRIGDDVGEFQLTLRFNDAGVLREWETDATGE
jgi:outer membrane protein assembly factor BamE (lipoprotein component of BamABCDE complex)